MNEKILSDIIDECHYAQHKYFILNDDEVLWLYYPKKEIVPQEIMEKSINSYYVDKYIVFEIPR